MKKYKYIGDGAGVMGLPHEITDEEAERDGLSELLAAAVENGSYVPVETGGHTGPPRQAKKKAESEVNDG